MTANEGNDHLDIVRSREPSLHNLSGREVRLQWDLREIIATLKTEILVHQKIEYAFLRS